MLRYRKAKTLRDTINEYPNDQKAHEKCSTSLGISINTKETHYHEAAGI